MKMGVSFSDLVGDPVGDAARTRSVGEVLGFIDRPVGPTDGPIEGGLLGEVVGLGEYLHPFVFKSRVIDKSVQWTVKTWH